MLNFMINLHVNFSLPARANHAVFGIHECFDLLRIFVIIASCDQIETKCFHSTKGSASLRTRLQGVCDAYIDERPYLCLH